MPTVGETVKGYEASAFFGITAPKGTPRGIIDKLNKTVNEALADPAMQAKLAELGGTLIPGTPEDFGKMIADETAKWAPWSRPPARRRSSAATKSGGRLRRPPRKFSSKTV